MDVERLMRDLTVEQLQNIQESLGKQADEKREELRKMVGRRYRDVLDASNTVKRLTEVAGELAVQMKSTRAASKYVAADLEAKPLVKSEAVYRLGLLQKLLPLLDNRSDELSDVFALILTENLFRSVSIEAHAFNASGANIEAMMEPIGDFLISHRLSLSDKLEAALGCQTEWQEVAGLLAGKALLNQSSLEDLLDCYLKARQDFISTSLKSSSTLINVIEMMKNTAQCVEDTFGYGGSVISALTVVTSTGWCPEEILDVIADEVSCYNRQLKTEIERVNASYTGRFANGLSESVVEEKFNLWFESLCSAVEVRIHGLCDFFDRTSDVVEFIVAINDIFSSDWPAVASNVAVYQKLFGDSLLQRYKLLIEREVKDIEQRLLKDVRRTQTNPPPLFQKRGARFDSLLASGVSQDLFDLIQRTFNQLGELLSNTNRYVSLGKEANVHELKRALADAALAMTERITQMDDSVPGTSDSELTSRSEHLRWLTRFRIYLALVQHEPSVLCQCMDRDTDLIVRCNKLLHSAADNAFCNFMNVVIDDAVKESQIGKMTNIVAEPARFLDLAQQFEKHKLPDSESTVDIPVQISRFYFSVLYAICQKINSFSVGHLFTRTVSAHVSKRLGETLAKLLIETANACCDNAVICTQVLFDCKALFFMFLDKGFMEAAHIVEDKLDPFNKAILDEPLSKNARLFAQRTAVLFGQLQAEPVASAKENELAASYTSLIDVLPVIPAIPRLPLIPGMSSIGHQTEEEKKAKEKPKKPAPTQNASEPMLGGLLGAKQPFSSFYDKLSTNWFKN